MQRTQFDGEHDYLATPGEYPIGENDPHSTYDQFIQLRDTLIFSGKYYNNKAGAKLIVGESKETIEVMFKNRFKLSFEPNYISDVENLVQKEAEGPYVTWLLEDPEYSSLYTAFGPLSCVINQDGRYRITHKEEIIPAAGSDTVVCYVDIYRKDANDTYQILIKGGIAVSWWECAFSRTFSGTTSGTEPNGSCSINVNFKLGDIFQRMPTRGYTETDLKKGDILVLRMRDAKPNTSTGEPQGNELTLEPYSNLLSVEYIDLPLGNGN